MALSDRAKRLLTLRDRIAAKFTASDWTEIGVLTDTTEIIRGHSRLLRSLSFGDDDYSGNVLSVLDRFSEDNLSTIEDYLDRVEPGTIEAVDPSTRQIGAKAAVIRPTAFQIPDDPPDRNLLSAMMPFSAQFDRVYQVIGEAAAAHSLQALRADNIWEHSAIIQDIFTLIFRSSIVVCDFSGTNPNVFYEAGIAHTLGKPVVPLAQHKSELPFDLQHHRAIIYQSNTEGLAVLRRSLVERIGFLTGSR